MAVVQLPVEWEAFPVDTNGIGLYRLRVLGGWLVILQKTGFSTFKSEFVPDSNHEWEFTTNNDPE